MAEELQELHEQAEKAREHPALVGATLTLSVMAVLVASISVLGHRAHTRTLLDTTDAADIWAEYQAKSIRRHSYELFVDLLSVTVAKDPRRVELSKAQYNSQIERYEHELQGLKAKAEGFEAGAQQHERQGARYDLGEVCLEAALVITSITLITGRKLFWGLGSALAAAGIVIAATAFWLR
ncbi:MAG TPA: DUF4337 domain-containing protein [Terriglobia bacterium]